MISCYVDNFWKLACNPRKLVSNDFLFNGYIVEAWVDVMLL